MVDENFPNYRRESAKLIQGSQLRQTNEPQNLIPKNIITSHLMHFQVGKLLLVEKKTFVQRDILIMSSLHHCQAIANKFPTKTAAGKVSGNRISPPIV